MTSDDVLFRPRGDPEEGVSSSARGRRGADVRTNRGPQSAGELGGKLQTVVDN